MTSGDFETWIHRYLSFLIKRSPMLCVGRLWLLSQLLGGSPSKPSSRQKTNIPKRALSSCKRAWLRFQPLRKKEERDSMMSCWFFMGHAPARDFSSLSYFSLCLPFGSAARGGGKKVDARPLLSENDWRQMSRTHIVTHEFVFSTLVG